MKPALAPDWKQAPEEHAVLIEGELAQAAKDPASGKRTLLVHSRIAELTKEGQDPNMTLEADLDWEGELAQFADLVYPAYYRQPFHSVPNGWLSTRAATKNRVAMQAIYRDAHAESCLGIRKDLAAYVPADAKTVVDFGSGDGDGPSAVARLLPGATVTAVEASPFMIIVGRRQNGDASNLVWRHALAENSGLPAASADAVTICLVFHECSDEAKAAIAAEALRVLRPGGTLVLSDTPQGDLLTYRGFYEPWKMEWTRFRAEPFLTRAGFVNVQDKGVIQGAGNGTDNRLWTWTCQKPRTSAKL